MGENGPTLCISRGRVCAHMSECVKGKGKDACPTGTKNSGNTEKSCTKRLCTKAKNRKNARKRREQNHQSAIKAVIFAGGMTNKAPENSHRRHIFSRNFRHFLCFPLGKRMFPPWKTYVSRQGNIRFSYRKHRKLKDSEGLSHRHFFNTERLKGKNGALEQQTGRLQGKMDRAITKKNKRNSLQENVQKNQQIRIGAEIPKR